MGMDVVPAAPFTVAGTQDLAVGEETISRLFIADTPGPATGQMRLTYFTAGKTEVTTQCRLIGGSTAAGATPTLVRVGLYLIAADLSGALIASIPNDTTIFSVGSTAYTRAWSASAVKVQGQRYAVGLLIVTAAAIPSIASINADISPSGRTEYAAAPRLGGALVGQADLPNNYADAALSVSMRSVYTAILP